MPRIKIENPTTSEKPIFGFRPGKVYYQEIPEGRFVRENAIGPAGWVCVAKVHTGTYATMGYSKDHYVDLAVSRYCEEWGSLGVATQRRRVDCKRWHGHDWYGRTYYDYSYTVEVWIKPHGPMQLISGPPAREIEYKIHDIRMSKLVRGE